ncbi:PepSY domain-containing protein [Ruixingdingia sedimenti]|uniref:PepSY domain-containing protein n=1 Tax=Ruixingdingia sedimenti TaxID=3073604 RepID=A0ABU1FBH2_9RHOB|nr:PepSY domain-containing protein [Xinfangfangia sp. LG-4]MDR5654187.1 PepSY domain-containing protein [Xinfangfangia sp. LG-4]
MIRILPVSLTLICLASPLLAQQKPVRPLSATVLDFESRGYVVRSAEDDGRTHDIEAITPQGARIEAIVEAATGEVLSERADD